MALTPLALFAALFSGGAGHGRYTAARDLFPLPMLLTRMTESISVLNILLAIVQLPSYGAAIGMIDTQRPWTCLPVLGASILHIACMLACFDGAIPNFS